MTDSTVHGRHGARQQFSSHDFEQMLSQAGIRVTAVRLLVLRTVYDGVEGTFSLQDVVELLGTADSSTVFRSLALFAEKGLLHTIDDGSGMQKYCVCHCPDGRRHRGHIHLSCTVCHKTTCLTAVPIPPVPIPDGFLVEEAEYVVKGVCPLCRQKQEG